MILSLSDKQATVLQRLVYEEIEHQKEWQEEDKRNGIDSSERRRLVIIGMMDIQAQLEANGIPEYTKA